MGHPRHERLLHPVPEGAADDVVLVDDLDTWLDDVGVGELPVRGEDGPHIVRTEQVITTEEDHDILGGELETAPVVVRDPDVCRVTHVPDPVVPDLLDARAHGLVRVRVVNDGEQPVRYILLPDAAHRLEEELRVAPEGQQNVEWHRTIRLP